MNLAKNHPEIIVPTDNRRRAFLRFLFSSFIGDIEGIVGLDKKQNKTIRNLYTAVRRVATSLRTSPKLLIKLAPAASSIRSFE